MIAIKTQNLTKKFKEKVAVDNLNIEINENQLISILGVNGAGKTTAIKMLSCLTLPTDGTAFMLGKDITKQDKEIKPFINISPQETAVAPNLTVFENLVFISQIYGFDKKSSLTKASENIKLFKLEEVKNKKAKFLSGGMQRRLSIALALISNPKILFLDEPTLGLDVLARRELWKIISKLKATKTIILTTHYMEEAEALSDTIAIMSEGKILIQGDLEYIKKQTKSKNLEDAFIKLVAKENDDE